GHLAAGSPTSTTDSLSYNNATLIMCTLYGGNDGLNTLIPYNDPAYQAGRPTLAYAPEEVIALDSSFGLNPSLKGFKQLWDAGQLAIIRGVGYPSPSYSHFRSMDIWQSAVPDTDVSTGWLGRWLDATGSDPLRSVSIGTILPMMLTGERSLGAVVPIGPMVLPGSPSMQKAFGTVNSPTQSMAPVLADIATSGNDMLRVQKTVSTALSASTNSPSSSNGSDPNPSSTSTTSNAAATTGKGSSSTGASNLADQLSIVSKLISAGIPAKVYGVSQASYDTHANEKATQARLLAELDSSVTQFVQAMAQDPKGQHSVITIYSEFGRRVQSNASGGTDHGSASVVFVAGPKVKGGYYGDQPSLTSLNDGNLVFTTDFRSVYATLLANIIGEDPKVSLGSGFPLISFI
ncbi:MAG TPA: DUF1501 domain-containing protein, partial [Acidimicrobiales bacterium]|nr:DUF1501 domain-containing protein [Acidimicrobiales bacterium]